MTFRTAITGALLGAGVLLGGCAEQAQRVPASYIPSIVYRGASCQELYNERVKLANHVRYVTREQRSAATTDTVFFTTSMLIFWPAIFALPLTVDQSAQLASARGHYDALSQAMIEQGCVAGARHVPAGATAAAGKYSASVVAAPVGAVNPDHLLPNWPRYPGVGRGPGDFPPM